MVKLLRTSKAFTYIEMVFVLAIVSILLILQFKYIPTNQTVTFTNHKFLNNLIMQFNYLKAKAIKDNLPITLIFNNFSKEIILNEPHHPRTTIKLKENSFIHPRTNIKYLTFDKNGHINKFGTVYIACNDQLYKIIFHIEKGRVHYEEV